MEQKKSAPKDINDNEAFELRIVVNDIAGKAPGKGAEESTVPNTTHLKEATADKILEEKLSKGENLAGAKEEVEMKRGNLDDRDNRLSKPNRDLSDEKPVARETDVTVAEKMKVEEEKLKVLGEESSDCLSSSSRRALKRTAQITPPPGKDATKVERRSDHILPPNVPQSVSPIFAPRRLKEKSRQQYQCQMASGRQSFRRR